MDVFSWPDVLGQLMAGEDLDRSEAADAMAEIISGRATPSQAAGFLVALATKGESASEMAGMIDAMMSVAVTVEIPDAVDIVGTGGDGYGTFNVSTTAAFVAAGAGVRIAKHGNRAASSKTGSADLLEALGFDLELGPEAVAEMAVETGFGFFFAPRYHPAMRHAVPVRKDLGVRTVFNFLGPLCNPGGARMCVGSSDARMARLMVDVLAARNVDRGFVVYGQEGLDELSTAGPSRIYRLIEGEITEAEFTPEDFGVTRSRIEDIAGGDAQRNVEITLSVLTGESGPYRDAAVVNAAPALVLAGIADGFVSGVQIAARAIDSGAAHDAMRRSLEASRRLATPS